MTLICTHRHLTSAADELFHRNKPILAAVDIDSRFCALLASACKRDYETWGIHLLDLQAQGYAPDTTYRLKSQAFWVTNSLLCCQFVLSRIIAFIMQANRLIIATIATLKGFPPSLKCL